jgi:hypothetical protein
VIEDRPELVERLAVVGLDDDLVRPGAEVLVRVLDEQRRRVFLGALDLHSKLTGHLRCCGGHVSFLLVASQDSSAPDVNEGP